MDAGTSRRSTPEVFEVLASALKQTEDGAVRLDDVEVDFDVRFPEDEQGAKAQKMVDRLIQLQRAEGLHRFSYRGAPHERFVPQPG